MASDVETLTERIVAFVGQCIGQADPHAGVADLLAQREVELRSSIAAEIEALPYRSGAQSLGHREAANIARGGDS